MDLAKLHAPFDPNAISWRVGSTTKDKSKGMALAYIDARDVQDRLDEVCGADGWQCRYVPTHDKKTICEIGIFSDMRNDWIWKSDGAGDSDVEAEKGALSDAFKRAAVRWGIGRYLYDLDSPWVELETYDRDGKTFVKGIKADQYSKLRSILGSKPTTAATPAPETTKPAMTPKEYATQCEARIVNIRTPDDAKRFRDANYAGLAKLDTTDPELFERVNKALITKEATFKLEMAR